MYTGQILVDTSVLKLRVELLCTNVEVYAIILQLCMFSFHTLQRAVAVAAVSAAAVHIGVCNLGQSEQLKRIVSALV